MYNIRKNLCFLTVLLFALSFILPKILTRGSSTNTVNSNTLSDTPYVTEVFDGDGEKFVAHRGYSGYAPENSIPAFEFAGKVGFWGIETDIFQTNDGQFVCIHDEELDRTTDGTCKVGDYSFEEIRNFKIDTGKNVDTTTSLKIPSFKEYLDICKKYDCVAVAEIKDISDYDSFLNEIKDSGLEKKCIITGELEALEEIRTRNSVIPVMTIGYTPAPYTDNLKQISSITENRGILYNYPQVDGAVIEELHRQDIFCGVWSVDNMDIAQVYLDYGADFIVTNEIPARLSHMINKNE